MLQSGSELGAAPGSTISDLEAADRRTTVPATPACVRVRRAPVPARRRTRRVPAPGPDRRGGIAGLLGFSAPGGQVPSRPHRHSTPGQRTGRPAEGDPLHPKRGVDRVSACREGVTSTAAARGAGERRRPGPPGPHPAHGPAPGRRGAGRPDRPPRESGPVSTPSSGHPRHRQARRRARPRAGDHARSDAVAAARQRIAYWAVPAEDTERPIRIDIAPGPLLVAVARADLEAPSTRRSATSSPTRRTAPRSPSA